jgi:hypothetical protein
MRPEAGKHKNFFIAKKPDSGAAQIDSNPRQFAAIPLPPHRAIA